ncbi:MAG TPA: lipid-A-disaccharide synthase [bacterium]|nr:lipid-A-disaccharide synthase [bacterium]
MRKKILIIAGETSGDTHGAALVSHLRLLLPDVRIVGIGGNKMADAGMHLLYHIKEMSLMGFAEVVKHLPFIKGVMDSMVRWAQEHKPDAVILIDYPGFNLRFARRMRKFEIPVYYYISPQVWAWGQRRLRKMQRLVHKIFVIFPFEEQLYKDHQIPVEFVGHPLAEEVQDVQSREEFFRNTGGDPQATTIGLLPGSRKQEIDRHLTVMFQSVKELQSAVSRPLQFLLALAPDLSLADLDGHLPPGDIQVVQGYTYEVMKYSQVVIVASGSATLETAYFGTPMVIIYRMNPLTWWLGHLLVRMDYIGLANIVAGKKVVPEFLQDQAISKNIAPAVVRYLEDPEHYHSVQNALSEIREKLGEPGAGKRVAVSIAHELQNSGREI